MITLVWVWVLALFKMSMTVGKRAGCSHQGGSPEPGHRYAVVECEIRYTCCRSNADIVLMLPSLCRWLVVERPPVAQVSWLRDPYLNRPRGRAIEQESARQFPRRTYLKSRMCGSGS